MSQYNIDTAYSQVDVDSLEPLTDVGRNGRERPWRAYKMANELLSIAYHDVDPKKSERLKECGKVLTFRVDSSGNQKLAHADSCRVRLCPLCSWRRSLKNFWNTMKILDHFHNTGQDFSYIFLTLTVRNCQGKELSSTLDLLFSALQRFSQRKEVRTAFLGMVRNVEVTHNVDPSSKDYDTFHPHIHCICAVRPSYFTSRYYLSQARLTEIWKHSLRVDYIPIIDVRRVKGSDCRAVAECSKYAAKAKDYIIPDDWDLTVETVRILDKALANRRLINYTGVFRAAKQDLALDDVETGDLVNVGALDEQVLQGDTKLVTYYWYSGYRQYYKIR